MIIAIDPGSTESGYAILDKNLKPVKFGKIDNFLLLDDLFMDRFINAGDCTIDYFAIEMIACYGMPVGKEVFDTCVWIGRFIEAWGQKEYQYIYRQDEKSNLCHSAKANDASIKQALVDRFASGVSNHGKGSKKAPGWFYGFKADIWSAYAVGVTFHDMYIKKVDE